MLPLSPRICQCMRRFFVKRPKFLAATSNLHVEQNLVHLGRFLHFCQKSGWSDLYPIQAGVFWNHIGWGHCVPPLFLLCLWSNYSHTWHDGTLGQNLSKAVKSLLTSSLGGKYDVIKPFLVSFQVKIRVPLSFVQLS